MAAMQIGDLAKRCDHFCGRLHQFDQYPRTGEGKVVIGLGVDLSLIHI